MKCLWALPWTYRCFSFRASGVWITCIACFEGSIVWTRFCMRPLRHLPHGSEPSCNYGPYFTVPPLCVWYVLRMVLVTRLQTWWLQVCARIAFFLASQERCTWQPLEKAAVNQALVIGASAVSIHLIVPTPQEHCTPLERVSSMFIHGIVHIKSYGRYLYEE